MRVETQTPDLTVAVVGMELAEPTIRYIHEELERSGTPAAVGKDAIHRYGRILGMSDGVDEDKDGEGSFSVKPIVPRLNELFIKSKEARLYLFERDQAIVGLGSIVLARSFEDSSSGENSPTANIEYFLSPEESDEAHMQAASIILDTVHRIDQKKLSSRRRGATTYIEKEVREDGIPIRRRVLASFGAVAVGAPQQRSLGFASNRHVNPTPSRELLTPSQSEGSDLYDVAYGRHLVDVYTTKKTP